MPGGVPCQFPKGGLTKRWSRRPSRQSRSGALAAQRTRGSARLSVEPLGRRLYALAEQIATYEPLWAWLGGTYMLHGGLMVVGGLMFGLWVLRAW
jgi:hypothetical protein